jgi:hypothetical protein
VSIRRYACPSELAPVLEAALAANGYTVELRSRDTRREGRTLPQAHL